MRAVLSILIWLVLSVTCQSYTYNGQGWTSWLYPTTDHGDRDTAGLTARNWQDPNISVGTIKVSAPKDVWEGDVFHALYNRYRSLINFPSHTSLRSRTSVSIQQPAAPAWYRSERANLVNYKGWISNYCGSFYVLPASGAGLNDYISNLAGGSTDESIRFGGFTYLTNLALNASTLCTLVGAPTNYFSYTPWRQLGGTNDSTNSYCYGYFTLEDYGWKYMRSMISTMNTICVLGQFTPSTNAGFNTKRCDSTNIVSSPSAWPPLVTCTETTLSYATSQANILGAYGAKVETFFGVRSQFSRTSKIDARAGFGYSNIVDRSMSIYFAPTAPNAAVDSVYSGSWNESSNLNVVVYQIAEALGTSAEWTYRIINYETPPEPDEVANQYKGYSLFDFQNGNYWPKPVCFVTMTYYYP